MCSQIVCEIEFFSSAPIHRQNVRSARSDIITVSCDFMKRLFQFFPPFFHSIFDENGRSSPRWLLSDLSLSLSQSSSFLCVYIFSLSLPLSLNFFPSIIRSVGKWRESRGAAWRGTKGEKISLSLSGKRIDYVRGSCLTRSISSWASIRSSITMTRWWNEDRWTLVFWSERDFVTWVWFYGLLQWFEEGFNKSNTK